MTIEDRQKHLLHEFEHLDNWEARYKKIIELGKALQALSDDQKSEDLKVRGCQSQVWLKAELAANGNILFFADSDALIVKGLVAILLTVFSNAKPSEILAAPIDFLNPLGFSSHLSPSRANGVISMIKQIKYYAAAYSALAP